MKNAFRFITVSLAIVALAACNQQTTAPTDAVNNNLVLGMGEIPMVAAEGLETQVLSTGVNFSAADPSDGAAIDFSVDGPADIVFDEVNGVRYVRTRVRVTNNTGGNITNLTLMGIAPRASTVSTLSRLRDLIGNPLSQEEAFNASTVTDPTAVDPAFVPVPTHPVVINDEGGVEIINTRADFVAYDEAGGALAPVISELNSIASSNPAFGLTGVNGTDFSLLPFGFQVGSLADGATGFVDVTFSLPDAPDGIGESPLARFSVTFVAVQDTVGRVTQAVEEIFTPADNGIDAGVSAAEQRLLNPLTAESNLENLQFLVLLGSAERDVTVPQTSVICIPDVRIGFNVDATIFSATRNEDASGLSGDCTLNDASSFSLEGDPQGAEDPQDAGQPIVDTFDEGLTVTLTDNGQPVVGRVIEAVVLSAPVGVAAVFDGGSVTGITDENGQVLFDDLVLNSQGAYIIEFRSGSTIPVTESFQVGPGPFSQFALVYTDPAGTVAEGATFPGTFDSVDPIVGRTTASTDAELALQAQDEFGNEVDLNVLPLAEKQFVIVAELLQGDVVASVPLISIDNAPNPADQANNAYPARDDANGVAPTRIQFSTTPANPGTFVFSGAGVTYTDGQADDDQLFGSRFRVRDGGENYKIRFTIADTVTNLTTNPLSVVETPEFDIQPTINSISIVPNVQNPASTGADLQGSIEGQVMEVLVLDTNGNPVSNVEVVAVATQCDGTVASGGTGVPTTAGTFYCNFASGLQTGGLFITDGTGAPDQNQSGVRAIVATTNQFGIATFAGPTGIQFGTPTPTGPNIVTFGARRPGTTGFAVTVATTPFNVEVGQLARLFISNDDAAGIAAAIAADPNLNTIRDYFGPVANAPRFAVNPANGSLNGADPNGTLNAALDIFVYGVDKYGNVLDVATDVTISAVQPNPNRIYTDDGGAPAVLINDVSTDLTLTIPASAGPGAANAAPVGAQFVNGADVFYVGITGAAGSPIATVVQNPTRAVNAATGDTFRVSFSVTGVAGSRVVSQTLDPTP